MSVLLTDLYELTMAYGYWRLGMAEQRAVFHHFYREQPFGSGFAVAAGLGALIEFLDEFRFSASDLEYLATLKNAAGGPLFSREFLDYLANLEFACDIDAIPEGTLIFPHEPLVRVRGPLLQAQMLETIVLNLINYHTLVATKSARVRLVAGSDEVIEFGLRRAQGKDGGLAASRAAYVGGADSTSNVEAGKQFGIPVRGTMAHSWVMTFNSEPEAFEAWATVMPDQAILLVDTYDTVQGVKNAIKVGQELKRQGKRLVGIRLDSGDLTLLSKQARRILDEAGLSDTRILASNELDEHRIMELKRQGAPIDGWGVGTRLVTGHDQPALGGVYKLGAIQDEKGEWSHRMKYAGIMEKTSEPGILQVRRFFKDGQPIADIIYDIAQEISNVCEAVDLDGKCQMFESATSSDLLTPIFAQGRRVYDPPPLIESRKNTLRELNRFSPEVLRLKDPDRYFVGMERHLEALKHQLMEESHARSYLSRHSK